MQQEDKTVHQWDKFMSWQEEVMRKQVALLLCYKKSSNLYRYLDYSAQNLCYI